MYTVHFEAKLLTGRIVVICNYSIKICNFTKVKINERSYT